jgi:hypothetical protein
MTISNDVVNDIFALILGVILFAFVLRCLVLAWQARCAGGGDGECPWPSRYPGLRDRVTRWQEQD